MPRGLRERAAHITITRDASNSTPCDRTFDSPRSFVERRWNCRTLAVIEAPDTAGDVWTALVKGAVAFAHSRAAQLTATTFKDAGSLVGSLFEGAPNGTGKQRLDQLKKDIQNLTEDAKPVIKAVEPKAKAAADAVAKTAAELNTDPFTLEAAGRAATELSYVLIALDEAIVEIANKVSEKEPEPARTSMREQIASITTPWKKPFANLGANASQSFDVMCKTLLDIDQAGKRFADNRAVSTRSWRCGSPAPPRRR